MTPSTDTTAGPAADAGPARLSNRLRAILAVVLIADVLNLMDSTITNIAAPSIVRDIGGGESLIKWLGASYALAMGVLLVVGGRLGDRYGKRRLFLTGIAGFTAASLACGLAAGPAMLIAGRLVQGEEVHTVPAAFIASRASRDRRILVPPPVARPGQGAKSASFWRRPRISACTASGGWAPSTVNIHSRPA